MCGVEFILEQYRLDTVVWRVVGTGSGGFPACDCWVATVLIFPRPDIVLVSCFLLVNATLLAHFASAAALLSVKSTE